MIIIDRNEKKYYKTFRSIVVIIIIVSIILSITTAYVFSIDGRRARRKKYKTSSMRCDLFNRYFQATV